MDYNISMKNLWYYPQYYTNFKCKASKCRNNCCSNWKIPVSHQEYNKLINMECSDDLYRRVIMAFVEPDFSTEERYRYISFNWLGECPLQDQKLCTIHRDKGEDFLPRICRLYPRSFKSINGQNYVSCSGSCEAVIERLLDSDQMYMVAGKLDAHPEVIINIPEDSLKQISLFQRLLKDRSTTLAESLYEICMIINEKEFTEDYYSDADAFQNALTVLKRLYNSNHVLEEIAAPIIERYTEDPSLYDSDMAEFEKDFPEWMHFFERVINNSMMYECFPFVDSRFDQTLSYRGLCVSYGLMRVLCAGNHHFNKSSESLVDAVCNLYHLIDHTSFYYNVNVLIDNAAVMIKL